MKDDFQIDEKNFDEIISRAVKKECYVEVISLVHNYLELHLKSLIARKLANIKSKHLPEKIKILQNRGGNFLKYLNDYNEIAFLLGCLDQNMYEEIKKFNADRNKVMHQILKKTKPYSKLKKIAKKGCTIQIIFNPFKFTEADMLQKMQTEWE